MRLDEPVEKRAYFGVPYQTWHGSPNRRDSEVVFALAHPRVAGGDLRQLTEAALEGAPSQMALTPLVLSLLEDDFDPSVHVGIAR